MKNKIFSALRVFVFVFLSFLLAANTYNIIAKKFFGVQHPSFLGWSSAVVVSGSMAGAEKDSLRVYDMVIIHRQRSYRLGDIISFDSGGALVTHRIVEETKDAFITKGDANNTADLTPTPRENIIGKVVLSLPQFGRVIQFAKTPAGLAVLAIIGCTFIIVPSLFGERRRDTSQGEKSK